MSGSPRALFVVEPRFLTEHVGVLRVIAHYHERMRDAGIPVQFALVRDRELHLLSADSHDRVVRRLTAPRTGTDTPTWVSGRPWPFPDGTADAAAGPRVAPLETAGRCRAADFDVSVITNPWLCDVPMPAERFTHGIVYDLVPNLLTAQALDLGVVYRGHAFAGAHHRGYAYYADHVDEVLSISESTAADFLAFYGDSAPPVLVDIPFEPDPHAPENDRWDAAPEDTARLLLVNALDLRKNILGMQAALLRVAPSRPVRLTVVGRERMPLTEAEAVLCGLAAAGMTVEWYRGASDACLVQLYASTDGLLFPSLYEGLGLPILEAQSCGLPALSSNTSSCREINLNPSLQVDPLDVDQMAGAIDRIVARDGGILAGRELRTAQRGWLAPRSRWPR